MSLPTPLPMITIPTVRRVDFLYESSHNGGEHDSLSPLGNDWLC